MNRRLAYWLLRRFGVWQQNESLIGDIEEEYRAGRPWHWLWRQTLVAIAGTNARALWSHKLLALRAVVIGAVVTWCFTLLVAYLSWAQIYPLTGGGADGIRRLLLMALGLANLTVPYWLAGWIVARLHREQQSTMVLVYAGALVLQSCAILVFTLPSIPPVYGALRILAPPAFALAGGLYREPKTTPLPPTPPAEPHR